MIKLTIIGAGSAVFTKDIVVDLLHISSFKNMHISLMDIDEDRLKLAKNLIDVVSSKLNAKPNVTLHTDRREALENSDFIQTTIQVGGYKPSTKIDFEIDKPRNVSMHIFDIRGRRVKTFFENQFFGAGNFHRKWHAKKDIGNTVANGIYFIQLVSRNKQLQQKIIYVK